uniref:Uncharacterized protein n=1 Tax=Anguilla anguilla TaxID=7936 RepID=A0A0E9W5W6_ANGAN
MLVIQMNVTLIDGYVEYNGCSVG